jgi:hypothetical protein
MEDHPFPPFKRIYDAICVRYHFCSKLIMAAGHDQNLYEIFADTDSENDEEFEGFDDDETWKFLKIGMTFFTLKTGPRVEKTPWKILLCISVGFRGHILKIFTINKNIEVVTY